MGAVKNLLKKTPLRKLWWKFLKLSPVKKVKKFYTDKRQDILLDHTLPRVYNRHADEPVDENRVLFVEPRYGELSNSFQVLYRELEDHYDFDLHVHYLGDLFVSHSEYVRNCKNMLADMATAKYVFLNEASRITSCVQKREETIVTQLWHGCGAFKQFGFSTADLIFGATRESMLRHPFYKNFDYVTVSSPEVIWAYAQAMNLEDRREIIRPVGTSRTDVFFREETIQNAFDHLYELMPSARGKKVILYAPTFRGRVAKAKTPNKFDYDMWANALSKDYVLLNKHHPLVKKLPRIPEEYDGTFVRDMTQDMTIEELLCVSDICISDYSSLIFEYSLFERPMIFFAYDLEKYFDWRGFYYNYDELTPGPIFTTNEEMIEYIEHIDTRFDKDEVHAFREKFMSACDGHATERIIEMAMGDAAAAHRKG